ncbi:MAG: PrsW family glutamic-type intramembrane protease [Vicinamibacterales bacterium]
MRDIVRIAALGLLTGTLLVLAFHAPGPVFREIQFVLGIVLVTAVTRSMAGGTGISALSLGIGPVAFLVIGAGHVMTAAGLDTASGITHWGLIPLIEEALKLLPVGILIWLHRRRERVTPNPSDLLMLGCFAGAGFALTENVTLVYNNAAVARDMALQYGPNLGALHLVPGAWGVAGYVGHAASTGFIAGGYGLGLALRDRLHTRWWIVPVACAGWILLEHMLANYYAGGGSRRALLLGNGRLTPWLFVLLAMTIVALDYRRHRATFAQSARLRRRVRMTRAALARKAPPVPRSRLNALRMFMSQLRLVNATAWFMRNHPAPPIRRPRQARTP